MDDDLKTQRAIGNLEGTITSLTKMYDKQFEEDKKSRTLLYSKIENIATKDDVLGISKRVGAIEKAKNKLDGGVWTMGIVSGLLIAIWELAKAKLTGA